MAENTIKLSAELDDDKIEIKAIIKHEMSPGLSKDKNTGNMTHGNFIQTVKCEHNGQVVFTANLGPNISKNPYLSFKISGGMINDDIVMSWVDKLGNTDSQPTKVQ